MARGKKMVKKVAKPPPGSSTTLTTTSSSSYTSASSTPSGRSHLSLEDSALAAVREVTSVPIREWEHQYFQCECHGQGGLSREVSQGLFNIGHIEDKEKVNEGIMLLRAYIEACDDAIWPDEPWPHSVWQTAAHQYLQLLDRFRWAYVQLLRYAVPSRLGEGVEHCRKLTYQQASSVSYNKAFGYSHSELLDLQLWFYLGVAQASEGNQDKTARATLEKALADTQEGGQRNPTWAKSHLARVLRRLSEEEEADKVEKEIIKHLKSHPNIFSPAALQEMFLLPGEQSTPLMDKLMAKNVGQSETPTQMTEHQKRKAHEGCSCCGPKAMGVKLQKCSLCMRASYCSTECQKSHWKVHKPECRRQVENQKKAAADPLIRERVDLAGDLHKWAKTMTPILTTIAPSALDLFTDFNRIQRFAVVIRAQHSPESEGLQKFSIGHAEVYLISSLIAQGMVTRSMIDELGFNERPEDQHEELKMHSAVFVILGGEDASGTRNTNFERVLVGADVNLQSMRKAVYDKDWEKNLKNYKAEMRFTF